MNKIKCNHEFIVQDSQWKKCKKCGEVRPVFDDVIIKKNKP